MTTCFLCRWKHCWKTEIQYWKMLMKFLQKMHRYSCILPPFNYSFFGQLVTWDSSQYVWCPLRPLQAVLSSVAAAHSREVQWTASEGLVVQLQALARGFLLRQRLGVRLHFLNTQLPAIITIQVSSHLIVQRWKKKSGIFWYLVTIVGT